MSAPTELRVFISSTFRDLQEEREHLVKKIFPEIRALCRERGITFTEVDLRWGLTDEDVVLGQVIRTCLEEIDRCRPYFIGITGERYGYVPELQEYYKDAELLRCHPWLHAAALENASIIDLEFRHALLNAPAILPSSWEMQKEDEGDVALDPEQLSATHSPSVFFFFRRHRRGHQPDVDELEASRLENLKERVRAAGVPVEEFRDPVSLGEMVHDALLEIVERDFSRAAPLTPLEEERSRHRAFAESRRHAYIPNPEYLKALDAWSVDDERPLVIYAESGSGKSSLVSFWCHMQRTLHPDLPVVEHYVGVGAGSSDNVAIMRHVMEEIRERFERTEELPSKPEEIEQQFANWLGFTVGRPLLLVIDGINQLTGRALDLHWLPPVMPAGVKLIITSTVEQTPVELQSRGWRTLGIKPLTEKEREAVVVRYLSEYRKALSPDQVRRIADDPKCSHPLFLRTLLEELRLDASHEQLDGRIERYLEATGTDDLFQLVLERMEDDYGTRAVREIMSLLWCSRRGLDETTLSELTGIGRLKLSTMVNGLDYHLVRKDDVLTFFHEYLRHAVEQRYLSAIESQQERHRQLATHFQRLEVTQRSTLDLLHSLNALGSAAEVQNVLTDVSRFEVLWPGADRFLVLQFLSEQSPSVISAAYDSSLKSWRSRSSPDGARLTNVLGMIADLFEVVGAIEDAERLQQERLQLVRERSDRRGEASVLVMLAQMAGHLGRMQDAEGLALQSVQIARETGDQRMIAFAVGQRGLVCMLRSENDEAMACFDEQERHARAVGHWGMVAVAVGHRGLVHHQRGEYAEAIACHREQEVIARSTGDRRMLAVAIGNEGLARSHRAEYGEALSLLSEQERIARALGDRRLVATAIGNRAVVYSDCGEHERALECFEEAEKIGCETGDARRILTACAGRANAYFWQGLYDAAIASYEQWETLARELDDPAQVAVAVGNRGVIHAELGEYSDARMCFAEQERIARSIGDRRSAAFGIGNTGVAFRGLGQYAEALECFARATDEHRAIEYPYGMVDWLEGTARTLVDIVGLAGPGSEPVPAPLAGYLPGGTDTTWRRAALAAARRAAEECVAVSTEISKSTTAFSSNVLLARLDDLDGDRVAATDRLRVLLGSAVDDAQRAECHYWLWRVDADDSDHRAESLHLYRMIGERTAKHEFRQRIDELSAAAEPTASEADDVAA